MAEFRNILVIQTAFTGDAVLAASLLEKLHAWYKDANISILVRKGNEDLYRGHPFLKEVLVWNKKKNKTVNLVKLLFRIRKNEYDCVINCHRYASSGFLAGFSGAHHIAGFKQNPFSFLFNYAVKHRIGDGTHEIERYNELIEDFTDKNVFLPKLYPTPFDEESVKRYIVPSYVCMAPGSVWFTKQMPVEKWTGLCDSINRFTAIYLVGTKQEEALCEKIRSSSSHPNIHILAGKFSMLETCKLMKHAGMNFVNDSAPLHFASATNAPVTAFFCSTVPEFGFGPLSDKKKVIQVEDLPCKPCGLHGYRQCPLGHFKCGHRISFTA